MSVIGKVGSRIPIQYTVSIDHLFILIFIYGMSVVTCDLLSFESQDSNSCCFIVVSERQLKPNGLA